MVARRTAGSRGRRENAKKRQPRQGEKPSVPNQAVVEVAMTPEPYNPPVAVRERRPLP